MKYRLTSNDPLTQLAKSHGINTWNKLTQFVQNLPYGRNENRSDLGLVLIERKGTCSSKHGLLKKIAEHNEIRDVKLILGIYRMNSTNTPKIRSVLEENKIQYIPEAHCYLMIDSQRIDFTSAEATFEKIENDIIHEKEITPEQVAVFKVDYHKKFLKNWIIESKGNFDFEEIWSIREKCIQKLAE